MNEFKLSDGTDENIFLIKYSALDNRHDPKFYHKKFIDNITKIKNNAYSRLNNIVEFSSETWNQKDYFKDIFPYIEISKINTLTGDIKEIREIEKTKAPSRAKMILRNNDIIISTTRPDRGAISSIKTNNILIASTGFSVLRKIINSQITKEYLFYILRLPLVLKQFNQRSSGGNYPAITQEEISKVIIPIPPKNIQENIINILNKVYLQKKQKEKQAKDLLDSIDTYLLDELGIILPKINNSLEKRKFEINLNEISSNRFDPDYYSYHYKILQDAILQAKTNEINIDEIESIVSIIKGGKTPALSDYSDIKTSFPLIKAGSYTDEYINLQKLGYTKEENNFEVQKGDIFILSAAHQSHYVGRQIKILNEDIDTKISYVGELICIRTIKELCNPMYLFSLLNLEIYKTLLNREKTGQTSHIYGKDIKKIKIPLPSIEKQNVIALHIQTTRDNAKQLKIEAKQDLENAKFKVEKMILGQ